MLKEGDPAPDFTAPSHDGGRLSLADFRGRKLLLWFFPQAGTPGCSLEARGLRDHQEYFDDNQIAVVGVSFDSAEDNAAFARKLLLKFPLLCDVDRAVALAYGACDHPRAPQAQRVSFLIDEQGAIARVYDQVDPRDHAARVLAEILGV